jgi:N-formylmaleamate deformylase
MWHSDYLVTNGVRMHYLRSGGGKPALLLLHGFSVDSGCFLAVADTWVERYDVVVPDTRGHGRSAAPPEGYDTRPMVTDFVGLIAALGLHKPIVIGHSMGAINTLALAGLYPELPRAIVLEDPPPSWVPSTDDATRLAQRAAMAARFRHNKRLTRDELYEVARRDYPLWSADEHTAWVNATIRVGIEALGALGQQSLDYAALAREIRVPALLITSNPAQGGLVSAAHAGQLTSLIPHLQVAHVPDAGHRIRSDRPEAYLRGVNEFLGTLSA